MSAPVPTPPVIPPPPKDFQNQPLLATKNPYLVYLAPLAIFFAIFFSVLFIVTTVRLRLFEDKLKQETAVVTPPILTTVTPSPTPKITIPADWKSYTDSKLSFTFDYPSDQKVNVIDDNKGSTTRIDFIGPSQPKSESRLTDGYSFFVQVPSSKGIKPETLLNSQYQNNRIYCPSLIAPSPLSINFASEPALLYQYSCQGENVNYFFTHQNHVFIVGYILNGTSQDQAVYRKIVEQTISSFFFSSPSVDQTRYWRNYNESRFHLSFRYPPEFVLQNTSDPLRFQKNQNTRIEISSGPLTGSQECLIETAVASLQINAQDYQIHQLKSDQVSPQCQDAFSTSELEYRYIPVSADNPNFVFHFPEVDKDQMLSTISLILDSVKL